MRGACSERLDFEGKLVVAPFSRAALSESREVTLARGRIEEMVRGRDEELNWEKTAFYEWERPDIKSVMARDIFQQCCRLHSICPAPEISLVDLIRQHTRYASIIAAVRKLASIDRSQIALCF